MKKMRSVLNKTELAGGVLFPLFTLFLILRDDPLTTNLSWVGNGLGYRLLLVLWAIAGALVFRAMIRALAEALNVSLQRREDLTFLLMIASMLVPYLPESFPFLAQLHILVSNLAFLALNLLILRVFYAGQRRRWQLGRWGMEMTAGILVVCALLYIRFLSVNSLLEMFYTAAMAWLLILARRKCGPVPQDKRPDSFQ
ncbi:hypothetical protein [Holdemania filiformis]|uniref:DUF998 domain-containing protein n=1 Tax=Holdemania filiformis TaxID=61171 RepID=A0A412G3F2_9FIRM|nr:hypothetical protein [Holdemania filiformis]MBS5003271.1 hypothetical protein [Holdemania filiformis]RGR75040.1 hypothetical protein DWY25_06360 [Holdemania filiformis]